MGVLGVRQVVDRVSLEVFSVICLFSLSSKDPKVADRCSAAGPEVFLVGLVLAFLLLLQMSGQWSCAVSTEGDWGEGMEGLGGLGGI